MIEEVNKRVVSLDIFRGVIIMLLVLESISFFEFIENYTRVNSFAYNLIQQFFHVDWIGLNFWDVIQPGFMFIAGVAMTISHNTRKNRGETEKQYLIYNLKRSLFLLTLGVALHWVYNEEVVFEFQNVLSQLAVTTLITALIMKRSLKFKFSVSFSVLILSTVLYRIYNPTSPFIPGNNIGTAFDKLISGHSDSDYWVSLNFLSTSAHTIWGSIIGGIVLGKQDLKAKIKVVVIGSISLIVFSLALHISGIEPIIKRISTVSFVLASGGISILIFSLLYFIFDIKNIKVGIISGVFLVYGHFSLLVYLTSQIVIPMFLYDFLSIFTYGIFTIVKIPDEIIEVITMFTSISLISLLLSRLYFVKIKIRSNK